MKNSRYTFLLLNTCYVRVFFRACTNTRNIIAREYTQYFAARLALEALWPFPFLTYTTHYPPCEDSL